MLCWDTMQRSPANKYRFRTLFLCIDSLLLMNEIFSEVDHGNGWIRFNQAAGWRVCWPCAHPYRRDAVFLRVDRLRPTRLHLVVQFRSDAQSAPTKLDR